MKNRFTARLSAAVLTVGIYCMCSPYPCILHAGETADKTGMAVLCEQEVPMACAAPSIFYTDPDTEHTEAIRKAAMACITALGDSTAVVDDDTGCRVDTGFIGDYETAMEVYEASKDNYYGNVGYSMDYKRLADGNVRLLLKTEYGTPAQAYGEHLEAESGTDSEKADQIFDWVCSHVSYADDKTVGHILDTKPGCVPDYNGICATTYTAVMDGITTCNGFSGMLLALFDLSGIPAAKVQNGQHAYNIALADGHYYMPQQITCGYGAELAMLP